MEEFVSGYLNSVYKANSLFHLGSCLIEGGCTFTGALRPVNNLSMKLDLLKCASSVIVGLRSHRNRKIIAESILLI
jgi:hypothetical protein